MLRCTFVTPTGRALRVSHALGSAASMHKWAAGCALLCLSLCAGCRFYDSDLLPGPSSLVDASAAGEQATGPDGGTSPMTMDGDAAVVIEPDDPSADQDASQPDAALDAG